jgi:hypothetical protein
MRRIRIVRGESEESLGKKIKLPPEKVRRYEKGSLCFSAQLLWDLHWQTGTPISYFFEGFDRTLPRA